MLGLENPKRLFFDKLGIDLEDLHDINKMTPTTTQGKFLVARQIFFK